MFTSININRDQFRAQRLPDSLLCLLWGKPELFQLKTLKRDSYTCWFTRKQSFRGWERHRKRKDLHILATFPSAHTSRQPGWSQELLPCFACRHRAWALESSTSALADTLARSWIWSKTARTRTGTQLGFQCQGLWLEPLYHDYPQCWPPGHTAAPKGTHHVKAGNW